VEYGTTTAYGSQSTLDTNLVTSHSAPLTGLSAGTLYHYRVRSTDSFGNPVVSGDFTFTTQDGNAPPAISNVAAAAITLSGATITWTTDQTSSSRVEYGTTTAYGSQTTLDSNLVTSHSMSLAGLTPGTLYHYRVRSANALGAEAISGDFTFTTAYSLWTDSTLPATASTTDTNAVTLGVKFTSDVNGYITGLRFYKGSGNSGTHVGSLWTSTGTLLASVTFTNETDTGWQQATFSTPVAITAGTVYLAAYHAPVGQYAITRPYFTAAYNNAPLHGLSGTNGVYAYGASPTFPTNSYQSTNYWVDVVFQLTPP
jgi:hypothetical protein